MTAWSHTWYGGEMLTLPEPPQFVCRFCRRNTRYDGAEVCEATQTLVHMDCHQDECQAGACSGLLCTYERCDTSTPCDWCGSISCEAHRPHEHIHCETAVT